MCIIRIGDRIRPDPRNPSGSEPDPIQFFKKVKLIRPDPNLSWLDPTQDQMTFNPVEIYEQFEKKHNM
jgi:hypothetical protein